MGDRILLNMRLIDRLRISRALTRTGLAHLCGFGSDTRTLVSRGGPVSVRTLRRLAQGLGVEPAVLIAESRSESAEVGGGSVQAVGVPA